MSDVDHDTTGRPEAEPPNWYALVVGLELGAPSFDLGPGLVLRKLPKPLSAFDLAACGAVGFREWALLEPLAAGATAEIESSTELAKTPGYDGLNKVWLVSALLVLRGFHRHICPAVSAHPWSRVAGNVTTSAEYRAGAKVASKPDLPPFVGRILDFHLQMFGFDAGPQAVFGATEAKWVADHLETFNRLASESRRFRFALEAAIDSRYAKDERAALARIWSGIEGLFDVSSELVFRLSLSIAMVLAPRGQEQLELFDKAKKLYGVRSKAVHGSEMDSEKMAKGLVESWHLLRRLLLDAVLRGAVRTEADVNKAIFG